MIKTTENAFNMIQKLVGFLAKVEDEWRYPTLQLFALFEVQDG